MAYTRINFNTKTEMKKKVVEIPLGVQVYQPNADITGAKFHDGQIVVIEGPHYPKPHRWYARVRLKEIKLQTDPPFFVIEKVLS